MKQQGWQVIIDIGSNTVRMAVYRVKENSFQQLMSNKVSCGLAGYIEDAEMNEEGVQLMIDTLRQFRVAIDGIPGVEVSVIATASLRALDNREAVLARVKRETGFAIDVISGEEEALYDFYGIAGDRQDTGVLTDCGGGSSEIAVFHEERVLYTGTIPVGSLKAYCDYVQGVFPASDELDKIKAETRSRLRHLDIPDLPSGELYAIGGTVRALRRLAGKLLPKERENVTLSRADFQELFRIYAENPVCFLRTLLKVKPERVHTLVPGMAIQLALMEALGYERLFVSESGVREGYLRRRMLNRAEGL